MDNDRSQESDTKTGTLRANPNARLTQLNVNTGTTRVNHIYSGVIKKIRIVLPILAIVLIIITLGWNRFTNHEVTPITPEELDSKHNITVNDLNLSTLKEDTAQETMPSSSSVDTTPSSKPTVTAIPLHETKIGKNELINPHFQSVDNKQQPFSITAKRATQSNESMNEKDENAQTDTTNKEMILESPAASMTLNSGNQVTVKADQGNYNQIDQYLNLMGNVILNHSTGYTMTTERLQVDLNENKAWSDIAVLVTGHEGTIDAQGITALSEEQRIIFNGPVKMTLTLNDETTNNLTFGTIMP